MRPAATSSSRVNPRSSALRVNVVPPSASPSRYSRHTSAPTPPSILLRRRFLVLDLDVEAVCKPLDRFGEIELLGFPNEGDQVALRPAAEAVVELVHPIHGKAGRPLFVERAASHVTGAGLAELSALRHDRDHVRCGFDLLHRRVLDPGHYSSS